MWWLKTSSFSEFFVSGDWIQKLFDQKEIKI